MLTALSKGNKGPIQLFSCGAALFGVKNVTGKKKKKEPIRPPSIYLKKAVLINGKQKQNTKKNQPRATLNIYELHMESAEH